MKHLLPKNVVQSIKLSLSVLSFLTHQFFGEIIPQESAAHSERQC
jgi:hypothetical protein